MVSTPPTKVLSEPVNFARSDTLSLAISAKTVAAAAVVPEPPIEDAKVAALFTTDSMDAPIVSTASALAAVLVVGSYVKSAVDKPIEASKLAPAPAVPASA